MFKAKLFNIKKEKQLLIFFILKKIFKNIDKTNKIDHDF
jgi:hypothetical protein